MTHHLAGGCPTGESVRPEEDDEERANDDDRGKEGMDAKRELLIHLEGVPNWPEP
jgi:hypothetical protein